MIYPHLAYRHVWIIRAVLPLCVWFNLSASRLRIYVDCILYRQTSTFEKIHRHFVRAVNKIKHHNVSLLKREKVHNFSGRALPVPAVELTTLPSPYSCI